MERFLGKYVSHSFRKWDLLNKIILLKGWLKDKHRLFGVFQRNCLSSWLCAGCWWTLHLQIQGFVCISDPMQTLIRNCCLTDFPKFWRKLAPKCSAIPRQPFELENCSNPLKMRTVLWFRLKNWEVLDLSFFMGDVIICRFRPICLTSSGPRCQLQETIFISFFK